MPYVYVGVLCATPIAGLNSYAIVESRRVGSVTSFRCTALGSREAIPISGDRNNTCLIDGTWSGEPLNCGGWRLMR